MTDSNAETFGYAEFGRWYDDHRATTLEPALDRAMRALRSELDDTLSDRDLARLRSISGRVKSKRRTWRKVSQDRYRSQMATVDDVPAVIDDLVGIRITCTNLRDIEMVQAALDGLPLRASRKRPLGLDPSSERDYVEAPKESGYRGWHVNLGLSLDGTPVTCELQVRTLLQDSWGELTHEDTYSKAGELPPLVEILSARMADLLATLDDIAEDLRNELDRIDEAIVADSSTSVDAAGPGEPGDSGASADQVLVGGPGADAADLILELTRERERPIELSALAWALQNEFGAEVSDDWFGFRTFKRFLRHVVPDGEITTGRQAYLLLPAPHEVAAVAEPVLGDGDADGDADGASDGLIPEEATALRRLDRGFPLIETDQWQRIFEQLAEAWRRSGTHTPSTRMVNRLSRSARDRAEASGEPLSRRHLDHVAKAVLATTETGEPMTADQIGDVFTTSVLERLAELRIITPDDTARRAAITTWLRG
jgi:ppGpp synthetase/RelA/SpoT-type nucleotidyltranferase